NHCPRGGAGREIIPFGDCGRFSEAINSSTSAGRTIPSLIQIRRPSSQKIHLIPEDRTAQALSDLFGAPLICSASIVAWVGKKAQELQQVYESSASAWPRRRFAILTKRAFASPASCNGRIRRRAWPSPSIASTKSAARSPTICQPASSCTTTSCPIAGSMRSTTPFCNAHILRELKSLLEFDHELWPELMRDMLLAANLAVDKARQAGARALPPDQLEALVERYWAAVR